MKRKFLISNFQFLILTFVILLAGFFRFYHLNIVPPSPSLDEVSLGWNAYSILETGKDEYGYRLPVLLRAYDDWRPAGYVYLVVPFVKVFSLSVLSVRLPSVLLSLLTVLLTYFLVKELFPINSPRRSASRLRQGFGGQVAHHPRCLALPLIASFLLAISPWHIYISRLGHEVNLGLTLNVLPVPQILAALGAIAIWQRISENRKKQAKIALVIFLIFHLAYLYHQYFVNLPFEQSDSFQYPLKKAIEYALANQDQYQKIVVTNQKHGYQSYMFYLFFSRYSPETYLKNGGTKSGGYSETHVINKFEFRPIDRSREEKRDNFIFIGNLTDFPTEVIPEARFDLLDGEEAMRVVAGG